MALYQTLLYFLTHIWPLQDAGKVDAYRKSLLGPRGSGVCRLLCDPAGGGKAAGGKPRSAAGSQDSVTTFGKTAGIIDQKFEKIFYGFKS